MAEPSVKDLAYRTAASVFGGPVDLATMVMRPFGYKTPDEKVFGSSEYIGKKLEDVGLVSSARAPITEFLTSMAVPTPGGLAKGAALTAPQVLSMFVGARSLTWDASAAEKAKMLADIGTDARTIWQQTGTWKGPDGKWRQEISDKTAQYDPESLADLKALDDFNYLKHTQPLSGTVEHPQLYKAYPDIGDIPVHFMPTKDLKGAGGSYSYEHNRLTLADTPKDQKSIALHETQHAIQRREGFARGGSPNIMGVGYESDLARLSQVKNQVEKTRNQASSEAASAIANDPALVKAAKAHSANLGEFYASRPIEAQVQDYILSKTPGYARAYKELGELQQSVRIDPTERYRRLAGEAEARATQARMNMTPAERRAAFPEESYDVPINQLIVR